MSGVERSLKWFNKEFPEAHADDVIALAERENLMSFLFTLAPRALFTVFLREGKIIGYSYVNGLRREERDVNNLRILDAGKKHVDVVFEGRTYHCYIMRFNRKRSKEELKQVLLEGNTVCS